MIIKAEQLPSRLKKSTLPLVWISGDETLLVQEACDIVRRFAREQGFTEREVMDAGAGFDWNRLLSAGNEISLFAERKLIDLRVATKVDEEVRSALKTYLENPNPDNMLLLTTGKLEKASMATQWFKGLEASALFCLIWPVSAQQLPDWIEQRLQQSGLTADNEAIALLTERMEGNLLAAAQEIEKLKVLAGSGQINGKAVMTLVADSSRFTVYTLVDASLAGNSSRALRILSHLQTEGVQSLAILNRLCPEIRNLAIIRAEIARGHSLGSALQRCGVWNNRIDIVSAAARRHSEESVEALLEKAKTVDQSVKGLLDCKPWDELADLVLGLSDPRLLVRVV